MEAKSALKSWTIWAALAVIWAPAFPHIGAFIHAHQDEYNRMLGVFFIGLRLKTNAPIKIGRGEE